MSPLEYPDAAGVGGTAILAHTEALPEAALHWFELMPKEGDAPEAEGLPDGLKRWTDPASVALFNAVVDWPFIALGRIIQRQLAADALITWVNQTSTVFVMSDQSGAGRISNSVGASLA